MGSCAMKHLANGKQSIQDTRVQENKEHEPEDRELKVRLPRCTKSFATCQLYLVDLGCTHSRAKAVLCIVLYCIVCYQSKKEE